MLQLARGWEIDVDVSEEWLFFRVSGGETMLEPEESLAEAVWSVAEDHQINRLVVELDGGTITMLTSFLVGQLVLLHKRAHLEGGVVRLCGLSPENYETIRLMGLADRFPDYRDREAAVMGYRPRAPK